MGSVVLTTLSIFLGLFFILVGSMKISPSINKEMHREIRRNFVQYSKVLPLAKTLGLKIPSKYFRIAVGWTEVLCGIGLIFVPGVMKQVANVVLLLLMLGASYVHAVAEDKFERTAPSIVFALLLSCRLVVYLQVRRKTTTPTPSVYSNKDTKQD